MGNITLLKWVRQFYMILSALVCFVNEKCYCTAVKNPCAAVFANPCENGGTCNREGATGNYTCACADGYEGNRCNGTN